MIASKAGYGRRELEVHMKEAAKGVYQVCAVHQRSEMYSTHFGESSIGITAPLPFSSMHDITFLRCIA